jgi:hypothetical protein
MQTGEERDRCMEIIMEHVRLCWAQRAHRVSQSPSTTTSADTDGGLLVELLVGAMTGLLGWDSLEMLLTHRKMSDIGASRVGNRVPSRSRVSPVAVGVGFGWTLACRWSASYSHRQVI